MPNQSKRRESARARAAALRAAEEQATKRRRIAVTSVGVVVALIAALVIAKVATGSSAKSGKKASAAPDTVVQQLTHVPVSTLATVGAGSANPPQSLSNQDVPATDGKPTVLYVGSEWCPYCATERWPLIVALSRFGTFGPLNETASSPSDVFPNTPTFSLHGVSYTSSYLALDAKELESNQAKGRSYESLDKLNAIEARLYNNQGFPYVNVAGRYRVPVQYDPKLLQGKSVEQIAAALSDPNGPLAKGIDGAANLLTAALCKVTNNQPASVCNAAPIPSLADKVSGS